VHYLLPRLSVEIGNRPSLLSMMMIPKSYNFGWLISLIYQSMT